MRVSRRSRAWRAVEAVGFWRELRASSRGNHGGPNTPETWKVNGDWASWGPPSNMVVGEAQYQHAIRKAANRPRGGKVFRLVNVTFTPEPENPQDSLAVAARVDDHLVGYLRAEVAHPLSESWASTAGPLELTLAGVARGGGLRDGQRSDIGVHVWPRRRVVGGVVLPQGDEWAVRWPPLEWELYPRSEGGCWEP